MHNNTKFSNHTGKLYAEGSINPAKPPLLTTPYPPSADEKKQIASLKRADHTQKRLAKKATLSVWDKGGVLLAITLVLFVEVLERAKVLK